MMKISIFSIVNLQKEEFARHKQADMKKSSVHLSLPKLTSRCIQDHIKKNSKSILVKKQLSRMIFNRDKQKQNVFVERHNWYTEVGSQLDSREFAKEMSNSQLKVASPFYKKLSNQDVKFHKCKCNLSSLNHSVQFHPMRDLSCPDHRELISLKVNEAKRFQQLLVSSVKQDHTRNHDKIQKRNSDYLSQSMGNSEKIRAEKYNLCEKNKKQLLNKLKKMKIEDHKQKEQRKVLLKERMQKVHILDNQNIPFEQILERRNCWNKERKKWGAKILRSIHKELIKLKVSKQKFQKANDQKKQLAEIDESEKVLLDIEKCLIVLLNNVSSADQLMRIRYKDEKVLQKFEEVFWKNLKIESREYGRKLCGRFEKIIQNVMIEGINSIKQKTALDDMTLLQNSQKLIQILTRLSQQESPISGTYSLQNSGLLPPQTQQQKEQSYPNTTDKRTSLLSKISRSSRKSLNFRHSLMLNSLSKDLILSKQNSQEEIQVGPKDVNVTVKKLPQKSRLSISKAVVKNVVSEVFQQDKVKKSSNCIEHVIYSISKQVINQNDEYNFINEGEDYMDSEDEYIEAKHQKFLHVAKQTDQLQGKQEAQRIKNVIDYVNTRIRLREAKQLTVSTKYQSIKFKKFCSQETFSYISSMIDEFEGSKKYHFLYGQLNLKKRIIEDDYIQELTKEFRPMFQELEFQGWSEFLLEQRNKVMFERLNKMIDLGMKELECNKIEGQAEKLENEKKNQEDTEKPVEFVVFKKVDQSQIAYERYLKRLQRKSFILQQGNSLQPKQKNSNNQSKTQQKPSTLPQPQQFSQKTINDHIEQNSTKTIRYTIVESNRPIDLSMIKRLKQQSIAKQSVLDEEGKKKALKYLLRKKPQQFQLLNKKVNHFAKFIKQEFNQEVFSS